MYIFVFFYRLLLLTPLNTSGQGRGRSELGEGGGSKRLIEERYLDLSGMVNDNQPQENDCRKAYQAF